MMRSMEIFASDDNSAGLCPKDTDAKQLSLYHNVMSAGKSKKKRVFMGFGDTEKGLLSNLVCDEVLKKLSVIK